MLKTLRACAISMVPTNSARCAHRAGDRSVFLTRNSRLAASTLFPLAVLAIAGCGSPLPERLRNLPNVILIVADDMGTQISPYGHPQVKTPHLARLAERGVVFERAYCQYPLCNPSRVSFLSGLRPPLTGVFDNDTPPRARVPTLRFLPEEFRAFGYQTFRSGKVMHATFEKEIAWDGEWEWGDVYRNAPRDATVEKDAWRTGLALRQPEKGKSHLAETRWLYWQEVADADARRLNDGRVVDEAIRLLTRERRPDRPFFLGVGFSEPHLPYVAPERFFRMYPLATIELPPAPPDDLADVPRRALGHAKLYPELNDQERRELIAGYYAAVSYMDDELGRLLEAVTSQGLDGNTVVIFLSDNGTHLGEHGGLWEKMTLFEESTHVPLIIAAPGFARGARADGVVELLDLYPTLVELIGLPRPRVQNGKSLVPVLRDPNARVKTAALSVQQRGLGENESYTARSLRTEQYRYTEWGNRRQTELYDHARDPNEFTNRADDPAMAAVKAQLQRDLDAMDRRLERKKKQRGERKAPATGS